MDRGLSIKAGTNVVACGCGQDEKVVVLFGLAQAGKRSFITRILQYGGYDDEARQFNSGAFIKTHITEEIADLRINIRIKKHALQDGDGETRQINLMAEEPEDLYELKSTTELSNRHVHIRLLDTPSICDEWVHAPAEESSDEDDIYDRGSKPVDTKTMGKLRILKEISAIGSLHGIFFIVNRNSPFSFTTVGEIKAHIDFFRNKNIEMIYSFVHTHTPVEDLFNRRHQQRAATVDRALETGGRYRHYPIDNHPDPDSDIGLHFSHSVLATILEDVATAQPLRVLNTWRRN